MKYPIGIQNFESLRREGYAYVDKTAIVHRLVQSGRYFFLSRPRRFGKSMLISTLEAYLSGKKELFKGLAIEQLEKEWTAYPVLHLDLNTEKYDTPEALVRQLERGLKAWEREYGADPTEQTPHGRFLGVIERASKQAGRGVVILIDEYDKPMLQAIGNEALQTEYRATLKAFYSVLKTQDRYIKFALLTGVTKFGKVSVFSDLNNLEDLSLNKDYYDICGITEQELRSNFSEAVKGLAAFNKLTEEQCYARLRREYDGYHFSPEPTPGIYNPFSVLNTLKNETFKDYWFETGTPTFLVELLKKSNYPLEQLTKEEITADVLGSIEGMEENPVPVIFQSGYLTIRGYDEEFGFYRLGFPNEEVERGFVRYLLPFYTPQRTQAAFCISRFVQAVRRGDVDDFMARLEAFFADTDYRVVGRMELYFQNVLWCIFRMMGFYVQVEYATSRGRADVVLQTPDYVYVLELKLDGSPEEALRQIEEKGYAKPFAADQRKLYKIGINFSSETRAIEGWKVE